MAEALLADAVRGGEAVIGDKGYAGAEFEALAACVYVNSWHGRPSRSLVDYVA